MGICLSCLRPAEEDEINERSSLLRGQDFYSDEHLQEEILKKQQRQQELNNIVNELNDNLIDVSTFLTTSTTPSTPNLNEFGSSDKVYPYVMTSSDKARIEQEASQLDENIKLGCQIENKEPLYLSF